VTTATSWDDDVLWEKTKLYVARASREEQEGPLFPFWSILALELLARTVLASVHPALLAHRQAGSNLLLPDLTDLFAGFTSDSKDPCPRRKARDSSDQILAGHRAHGDFGTSNPPATTRAWRQTAGRARSLLVGALPRIRTCAPRSVQALGCFAASKLRPLDRCHGVSLDVSHVHEIRADQVLRAMAPVTDSSRLRCKRSALPALHSRQQSSPLLPRSPMSRCPPRFGHLDSSGISTARNGEIER
jgi:hypothetical protein